MKDNREESVWVRYPFCGGKARIKVYEDIFLFGGRITEQAEVERIGEVQDPYAKKLLRSIIEFTA